MKKFVLIIVSLFFVFALTACDDLCVGAECITGEVEDNEDPDGNENPDDNTVDADFLVAYTHLNGHGVETDKNAVILFEVEVRDYVKYQIAYLSCTCRDKVVNYWNVAYIEINKYSNDVRTVSFNQDGENGHYTPGTWGDSSGDPNQNGVTFEQFEASFFPWLVGQTSASLDGISYFRNGTYHDVTPNTVDIAETDLIDEFAGSSVSTNNLIRVIKELLTYHEENYS